MFEEHLDFNNLLLSYPWHLLMIRAQMAVKFGLCKQFNCTHSWPLWWSSLVLKLKNHGKSMRELPTVSSKCVVGIEATKIS